MPTAISVRRSAASDAAPGATDEEKLRNHLAAKPGVSLPSGVGDSTTPSARRQRIV